MTVDPFKNHFNKTKLLQISDDLVNKKVKYDEEFKTLVHVEGKVLKVTNRNGVFEEIIIQDASSSIIIPVLSFDQVSPQINCTLMCVGTIHYDWKPDLRCEDSSYPVAIKAVIIKRR